MPSDRVTLMQKTNGDWVVRYRNRTTNHGKGASGRAHAQRQVATIYKSKYNRRGRGKRAVTHGTTK